jgi:WD40 repeat protein
MNRYELTFTIPSPGTSTAFMEFSPDGRFLAIGGQGSPSLYVFDKLAGFHPKISATTRAVPTALVWETDKTFYVGLSDGDFIHYRVNLKENKLVEGVVNGSLRDEGFAVTAMALDVESKTLVLSVGPGVFAFRRTRKTGKFHFDELWR